MTGARGALRYLAVGDSVPRGFRTGRPHPAAKPECGVRLAGLPLWWFDHPEIAYPSKVAWALTTGERPVQLVDVSRSGIDSDGVWLGNRPFAPLERAAAWQPHLVTITLGGNDFLRWPTVAQLPAARLLFFWDRFLRGTPLRTLVGRVARRRADVDSQTARLISHLGEILDWLEQSTPAVIAVTNYANGTGADAIDDWLIDPLNHAIGVACAGRRRVHLIDVQAHFEGHDVQQSSTDQWMTSDGLHPNEIGQMHIAAAIVDAVREDLAELA